MGYLEIIVFLICVLLTQGAVIERFEINTTRSYINKPVGIKWSNCGTADSPIMVKYLNVEPHPLTPGKPVHFSSLISVSKDIGVEGQILSLDASLKYKTGGPPRDLCQLLGVDCHLDDLCKLLGNGSSVCGWIFKIPGFYCKCPITAMGYNITIPSIEFPQWVFEFHGTFVLEVAIKDSVSVLGCLRIEFCLNKCSEQKDVKLFLK